MKVSQVPAYVADSVLWAARQIASSVTGMDRFLDLFVTTLGLPGVPARCAFIAKDAETAQEVMGAFADPLADFNDVVDEFREDACDNEGTVSYYVSTHGGAFGLAAGVSQIASLYFAIVYDGFNTACYLAAEGLVNLGSCAEFCGVMAMWTGVASLGFAALSGIFEAVSLIRVARKEKDAGSITEEEYKSRVSHAIVSGLTYFLRNAIKVLLIMGAVALLTYCGAPAVAILAAAAALFGIIHFFNEKYEDFNEEVNKKYVN